MTGWGVGAMARAMKTVRLSDRVDAETLITSLHQAGVRAGEPDDVCLDLGKKLFFDTSGLCALASWGHHNRELGGSCEVGGHPAPITYLSRMDVLTALGQPRFEVGSRRAADGRLIEARPQTASDGKFTDAVCELVLHHFDDARAFLPALEWAVNEVTDNIHNHAHAPTPGYACAQFYPNRHRIEVAVVDPGRGLRASLSHSHEVPDDEAAIALALTRGVTGGGTPGQGNGLAGTRAIVTANGGAMSLWSGTCRWRLHRDGEKPPHVLPSWEGTGLWMSLDVRKPVNLQDTFIEGASWSYIDKVAEDLAGEALRVGSACSSFGSRHPARRLRRKVLTVLGAMEPDDVLTLDFSGVKGASSSFLDELLGLLAAELGVDAFRRRVRVVKASDEVQRRANVVITQRVGEPVG